MNENYINLYILKERVQYTFKLLNITKSGPLVDESNQMASAISSLIPTELKGQVVEIKSIATNPDAKSLKYCGTLAFRRDLTEKRQDITFVFR
ncbi:hypothetical protein K8R47_02560 [archaeon]|nr:hypothetical protein [archaeon]